MGRAKILGGTIALFPSPPYAGAIEVPHVSKNVLVFRCSSAESLQCLFVARPSLVLDVAVCWERVPVMDDPRVV